MASSSTPLVTQYYPVRVWGFMVLCLVRSLSCLNGSNSFINWFSHNHVAGFPHHGVSCQLATVKLRSGGPPPDCRPILFGSNLFHFVSPLDLYTDVCRPWAERWFRLLDYKTEYERMSTRKSSDCPDPDHADHRCPRSAVASEISTAFSLTPL